jgi:uncharacterized C2H2 Zn-finger protein
MAVYIEEYNQVKILDMPQTNKSYASVRLAGIISMSRKRDNTNKESHPSIKDTLKKLASDFQCSVCGAIFTTDEDRKQHLEKEAHGILHEGTTKKDKEIAKMQEEENETYSHRI